MSRYNKTPTTPYGSRNTATPKSKTKQKTFSFPMLDTKELLTCLNELCPNTTVITEDEILHCEKQVEAVRRTFENILENLLGVHKDEINQPVFVAHESLSYSNLHEYSIPELAFWRHISSLMEVCGISDFSREDLNRPNPKRLKRQLCALVNFAKFKDERMTMYDEITKERDNQLARLSTIDGENAALQEQLDRLKETNKVQREEVRELTEETSSMAAKVSHLNHEQGSLRHESATLKEENASLKEKLRNVENEHITLIGEQKKLQGQVVQSPERVRREMHEFQRELESELREGNASEEGARVAALATEAVKAANVKVVDANIQVNALKELTNNCVEYGNSIKEHEKVIANHEKQKDEIKLRTSDVERGCVRLTDKHKHFEESSYKKTEQAARKNEESREKLLEQKRKKALEVANYSEEDRTYDNILSTMQEEEVEHRRAISSLELGWKSLENTILTKQSAIVNEIMTNGGYQTNQAIPQTQGQGQFNGYDAYAASTPMTTPYRPTPSPYPTAQFSSHFNETNP